jgi:phosphotriesterase-related protein
VEQTSTPLTSAATSSRTVETATGPIDATELGRTLVHEHLRISFWGEEYERTTTWRREDTIAVAVDKMAELLDIGFRTFVDPCPIELGRDPELYAEVAQRSGMNIVFTTGFYTEHAGRGLPVYWRARDPEEIAEHYVAELNDGVAHTGGIRPGAIKAATGFDVTDAERRVLAGAGLAQRETGVALITHTESSRHGDVQQEVLAAAGADLSRVLIGHQDEQPDFSAVGDLARRGTFVGIDRIGLEALAPDARRAECVAALVQDGLAGNVCLSQDHVCSFTGRRPSSWIPPEARTARAARDAELMWQVSRRPYTYIYTDFVPRLVDLGVSELDVERMFVDNPRRLLAGR